MFRIAVGTSSAVLSETTLLAHVGCILISGLFELVSLPTSSTLAIMAELWVKLAFE